MVPCSCPAYVNACGLVPVVREVGAAIDIALADADAEIDAVPTAGGGHPELDRLSNILRSFNEQWGNIPWQDRDRIDKLIREEIPPKLEQDTSYRNAIANGDRQNARIEHDEALGRIITAMVKDDAQLYQKFFDNPTFRRWLQDVMFGATYRPSQPAP